MFQGFGWKVYDLAFEKRLSSVRRFVLSLQTLLEKNSVFDSFFVFERFLPAPRLKISTAFLEKQVAFQNEKLRGFDQKCLIGLSALQHTYPDE